jgi:hypothetical protein
VGRRGVAALALVCAAGCHPRVPTPPIGPHEAGDPVNVGSAPPTVRAEIIPPRPSKLRDPRWIDGEWRWRASEAGGKEGRWLWEPGRWVDWPGGKAWYAPPLLTVVEGGELWWAEGRVVGTAPAPAPSRATELPPAPPIVAPRPASTILAPPASSAPPAPPAPAPSPAPP